MKRAEIKPGRVFEDRSRTGRRIVTRVQDGIVYYIVIVEGIRRCPQAWTHGRGGHHSTIHAFVDWADREVGR